MPIYKELLQEFEELISASSDRQSMMQRMCDRLHEEISRYNWVGFYLIDKDDPGFLMLKPHTGSFTPHARISLGRGLCGTAASSGRTVVVDDVTKDPRYLAGSDLIKSEIVVPIFVGKKLVCELDAESYFLATFNGDEREFVEACGALVQRYLETHPE
jgi:GAF domain-containing protein